MQRAVLVWLTCLILSAAGLGAWADTAPLAPLRIDIADPARHWRDSGFVELTPAIRVSVPAGARTAIYLAIPDGATVRARMLPEQGRATLVLPPGSVSDRVGFTADEDGRWTVEDVRGTRWGADGREYFHVYRPLTAAADAALAGYEWPRDDPHRAVEATALLTQMVRDLPQPFSGALPSWGSVARFRALNQCERCHVADKAEARADGAPLPPWATDASGLYVPLAVLGDRAPLSTTPFFDDPNAGDPFVAARCAVGAAGEQPAQEHLGRRSRWFSCPDGGVPVGIFDVAAALKAGDAHARLLCASRRYLFERMDADARRLFAASFAACGIG